MKKINFLEKIVEGFGLFLEKTFFPNLEEEYKEYKRCFEGTPEEVDRKLAAWDWSYRITRDSYHHHWNGFN